MTSINILLRMNIANKVFEFTVCINIEKNTKKVFYFFAFPCNMSPVKINSIKSVH